MNTRLPLLASLCALAVAAPAADAPSSRDFAWLSGHWCSQRDGTLIEESWLPPNGDLAIGMGRTTKDGRTESFEFMRIESREGIVEYLAMPQGRGPTAFRLTASGRDWARFENPQHDFPQRVEYRRTADGLRAEIAGPGRNGQELLIPFDYRRCQVGKVGMTRRLATSVPPA